MTALVGQAATPQIVRLATATLEVGSRQAIDDVLQSPDCRRAALGVPLDARMVVGDGDGLVIEGFRPLDGRDRLLVSTAVHVAQGEVVVKLRSVGHQRDRSLDGLGTLLELMCTHEGDPQVVVHPGQEAAVAFAIAKAQRIG